MIKNKRLEERRKKIPKDVDISVQQSFDIVDRIHEILVKQGKEQKDLARLLSKSESEISKWMTGTHNFTINTLAKIQAVLGESVIQITKERQLENPITIVISSSEYVLRPSNQTSRISTNLRIANISKPYQHVGNCLN